MGKGTHSISPVGQDAVPSDWPAVVLLLFNRPAHTRRLLEALRPVRPPVMYLVADGPRLQVPADAELCREVRALCEQEIDWPAEVHRDFSPDNLGLRRRVGSGLTWVFSKMERAIILEDDCLPEPSFFRFCAELLERYSDDERVGVITGDNFQAQPFASEASYYFSKYPHCWGWATWRRAWAHFDDEMRQWPALREKGWLREWLPDPKARAYWQTIFDGVHSRRLNSWAFGWTFACWSHVNLVQNIGMGNESTHTTTLAAEAKQSSEIEFPLKHPGRVETDQAADDYIQRHWFAPTTPKPEYGWKPLVKSVRRLRSRIEAHPEMKKLRSMIYRWLPAPNLQTERGLARAQRMLELGPEPEIFRELNALKAQGISRRGLDYLRALHFRGLRQTIAVQEALKEELRFFPDHREAAALLQRMASRATPATTVGDAEFQELYARVRPYTMVGVKRVWSLWQQARRICEQDEPGNFVECGVAAGGTSGLLATALARYSKRPRLLFSCDTFAGMPPPTEHDAHEGQQAADTGWGAGTCAAPMDSLLALCRDLGASEWVRPVQGLFGETLPARREEMGELALLHMDGDWYESTRDVLVNLYDHVRPGGFIQIDDFGFWEGCRRALEEFRSARGLTWELHDIDGDGVWMEKPKG
jgi:hypothetical protein